MFSNHIRLYDVLFSLADNFFKISHKTCERYFEISIQPKLNAYGRKNSIQYAVTRESYKSYRATFRNCECDMDIYVYAYFLIY